VLLADSAPAPAGAVWVLAAGGKSKRLIEGLERPYGLAFWNGYLYVGEPDSVKRYAYNPQDGSVGKAEQVVSLAGLTADHWTRSLLFDRAGKKLYVGVGSGSNDSTGEDPRRAAIDRYNPDGSGHEIFASGLRNPIGIHWYPGTDTLWAAVQERDGLGEDVVPDYFTPVQQGGFYGWPYAYIGRHPDPKNGKMRPDLVAKTLDPEVVLEPAHVAVLDFAFYTGSQFPQEYRGGAFLALHGSWNRSKRVGYAVGFIPFRDGKPAGPMRDFLTGWMLSPERREVWGRPVAVLVAPDGSLLVSEDGNGTIWRVSYKP
jgi:glucose/arabinose dehydrogenase